ncbi:MAG: putative integrase [Herbaspirillum sp.]|nr:putative integrase [Herbaspirillum sp.]
MNRARKKNKGLPRRVYITDGSYRFLSPAKIRDPKDGKLKNWITLARVHQGEAAMLAALCSLLGASAVAQDTMPYLCGEFRANKLKRYSDEVQAQYKQYLEVISEAFADFLVVQVTTKVCADFLKGNFRGKANTAQKYAALMRKVFRYAISELGLREDNPVDQLDMSDFETKRRAVLPTHAQIKAIREAGFVGLDGRKTQSGPMFGCLIDMSYLCWQRAIDVRTLKESQIQDGRIRFTPSKTAKTSGKTVDITITPAIQSVIDAAREAKKKYKIISPYLFPTKQGAPYAKTGLFSMWDRARERAKITEDVTFRDIRALGATDAAKRGENMGDIQTRLAHTSSRTSEIYIKEVVPTASGINMEIPWKSL